ncbi:MAG TPA: DUF2330 domain-containing protein [Polyangiaceae bacterium]|jgi:hypothetical protein|nr:DUF2330 domain-containing protein [Polyangiaceae bacterium]
MKLNLSRASNLGFAWLTGALLAFTPSLAHALPGFFAGKDAATRVSRSTQVVVMNKDDINVVSVMTDFDGPNQPFAFVMPVPKDVSLSQVKTLKRASVERLDELTAPRFHEFWEKAPCEEGKPEQIWEQSMIASSDTDFLGAGDMFKGATKAPSEMRENLDTDFRQEGSEYTFSIVPSDIKGWLSGKGFQVPAGVNLDAYSGMSWLVAIVDPDKVELGKKGESLLSPIRYVTHQPVKINSTLGLAHNSGFQELIVYTINPTHRFEVANYPNHVPPTNLQVDFAVKERMGEYYAALHDMLLAKDKKGFLTEYSWETKTCGEPCTNAKLALHELLTLGADAFEEAVPNDLRNPPPAARTPEEEDAYKKLKKNEKKEKDELAKEVARRAGIIARENNFVLTRLHHRYDKESLNADIELKPAAPIEGGVGIPQGAGGDLPQGAKEGGKNDLQIRFVSLHPDISVITCPNPERNRWGKPPLSYRGAHKIWVADQLAMRDRKQQKPLEVTLTAVPDLGIAGAKAKTDATAAAGNAAAEEKKSGCAFAPASAPGLQRTGLGFSGLGALALGLFGLRRRRARRG